MPRVSVIIPTYNCGQYICETLNSVIEQAYEDYEIIIIDSSSTDNTKELIERYINKSPEKIKYFYQESAGVAAARNKGLREAKGEFIAFLDGDDIWLTKKLGWQIKIMEENPEVAMLSTDVEMFNQDSLIKPSMWRFNYTEENRSLRWEIIQKQFNDSSIIKRNLPHDLLFDNVVITSSVIVRRKCLDQVGYFDTSFSIAEDYDLWVRISEVFPIIYFNKVTARYRYREDGLSGERELRKAKYDEFNGMVHEKLIKRHPDLRDTLKERIYLEYREASWRYLINLDLKKARLLAIRSIRYNKLQPKLYLYILFSFMSTKVVKLIQRLKKNITSKGQAWNLLRT